MFTGTGGGVKMVEREYITRNIKPSENTTLAQLSVIDMIRLLFSKMSNNDVALLDANEKVSSVYLKNTASLTEFLEKAIEPLKDGRHNSVTLALSSEYLPYLDSVINETNGLGQFYNIKVENKDLPLSVKYKIKVIITKK